MWAMKGSHRLSIAALACAAASLHAQQQPRPLDTIRVAARSPEPALALTRSTEVIDRAALAKRAGHDLSDILAASLGLDVFRRSPAQADLSIRGSSFNQIVILVDGVRVSDVQSGHYNLDLAVPMESIERIEILRGGGSTQYGADAIGGVVNIVTRRPGTSAVSAHGGSFGTAGADLGMAARAGASSLFLSADARRSDGHRDGTDYRAVQARVSGETPLAGGTLAIDGGVGVRDFGAADFYGAFPSYEDTRTATTMLSYERAITHGWRANVSADARRHYDLYTLVRTNPATYQNRHVSWQDGGRAVASGRIDRVGVAAGVEGLHASLESARLGDRNEDRAAGFTELSLGSARKTIGMLGTRLDWSSRTATFFSPGISVATAISPTVRLRGSASRGFRAPTWTEAYYTDPANVANPDLRSETFDMGELGGRATRSWGWLDLGLFARRGKDLIDWTKPASSPTSPWRSTNLESATFHGAESELGITRLANIEWRVRATGLRFRSTDSDTLIGKYALSPITESVSLQMSPAPVYGVQLSVTTGRARRAREEPYQRVDLRATTVLRGWTLRLDGLNLGDAHYKDAAAQPAAGKMLLLGIGR